MAYYSKYTGAELEEKLDKVEEIPQLIAQMITGKDFVTKEDLLCVLKDYAPEDYRTIPIDNNTIYWENGVLKAATSEGGQCQWELREHNGIQYLYSRLPVVTQYDVTMYADVNHLDLPSIYDGLPIDGDTIYWEETENGRILKSKYEGSSGVDASEVLSIVSNAGFATQNWVNNQNFISSTFLNTELAKYVKIKDYQEIDGVKNFLNGLQIANIPITKLQDDVLYIDSNVVIRGGLTMYYEDGDIDLPSIKEEIGNAGYDGTTGLASFNSEHFSISSDGIVSIIGGTGGLDIEQLESYLTSNKYVQQSYVDNTVSNINNRLNDFLTGTDTDTIINKWKELELFLEGLTESDNLATILSTKWTTDNSLINKWNTAYGWGNHASVGYALKSYVDDTFVTVTDIYQSIEGIKNFVNGLEIGGIKFSKTQEGVLFLEGNLVVKGGVTMYGDGDDGSSEPIYSTLGSLLNVDSVSVDATATVDRVLFQQAGSATWVTKPLSEIGGGSSGGGSVSGDYLPLSGGTLTGTLNTQFIRPSVNAAYQCGTSSLRWDNIYSVYGNFSNSITINGSTVVHAGNISSYNAGSATKLQTAVTLWGKTFDGTQSLVGSLKLNNNDLEEVNAIIFADSVNASNEGIFFVRSDANYDRVFAHNGEFYIYPNQSLTSSSTGHKFLTSGNYHNYALPLSGGTLNGTLFVNDSTVSTIRLNTTNTDCGISFKTANSSSNRGWIGFSNQYGVSLYNYNSKSYGFAMYDNGNVALCHDKGNVGIGTTSPAYKLDVNGSMNVSTHIYIGNTLVFNSAYLAPVAGKTVGSTTSLVLWRGTGSNQFGIVGYYSNRFIFGNYKGGVDNGGINVYDNGNITTYGNGNFGIGTTSPSHKLHVAGTIASSALIVNGNPTTQIHLYPNNAGASYYCEISAHMSTSSSTTVNMGLRFNTSSTSDRHGANAMTLFNSRGHAYYDASSHTFNSNILTSGGITMYSDIRKKTKLQDVELSLSQIANAPLIEHYYNSDQNKTTHVGSIAQYWAGLNDWFCKLDNEGYYTMEIQNCALASAISIARHLEKYESKTDKTLRKMKQRIQELEDEVERLKNN